jgi:hypothetical protein
MSSYLKGRLRAAGVGQNPVKTIVYWMLVFTSMTTKGLDPSFLMLKGQAFISNGGMQVAYTETSN